MNLIQHNLIRVVISFVSALTLAQGVYAGTFDYQYRDLMMCFRKTGLTGGSSGAYDLEVNLGQAAQYYNAVPGSTFTITQFTTGQIEAIFDNLNDLSWSVGGYVQSGDGGDASVPPSTLWVTAPRTDPAVQTIPWVRRSVFSQQGTATKLSSILSNARFYSGTQSPDLTNNTSTVVRVPAGSGQDYGTFMGAGGNYSGTFQANVENTTPPDFTANTLPSRSDFYELRPSSTNGPAIYRGYFELKPNGTMTFTAAGAVELSAPRMEMSRQNGTNMLSFTFIPGVNYAFRYTNCAGLASPITTWPKIPLTVTNGVPIPMPVSPGEPTRYYILEVTH